MAEAIIYDAVRTPRGKGKSDGSLHSVKPVSLVTGLIDAVLERNPALPPDVVDDVVLGCVTPVGDQGADIAKTAAIAAGLPDTVAGVQVNRFCASGLEAVNIAAQKVGSGFEDAVLAGGVESMSRVPMGTDGGAWAMDPLTNYDSGFVPQGIGADLIATIHGFSRADVDAFAVASQARATRARQQGYFAKSVVPVRDRNGLPVLIEDELIKPATSLEGLAKLRASFEVIGHSRRPSSCSRWPSGVKHSTRDRPQAEGIGEGSMERTLFNEEHQLFRRNVRAWIEKEVVPHREAWEAAGIVPRELYLSAGEHGFLCPWLEEEWGGPGADFLCSVIVSEELARVRASGVAFSLHSDIVAPYLSSFGTEAQKKRWLPGCASGELISAIAMTEPSTGSDLAGIQTTAIRDGDHYVVNGQKTFISNGHLCDLVVVAVKTDPNANPPHSGVSMLVVEADTPGFQKGRMLEKIGMKAQDTAELYFEDCRVPVENLLGQEGHGFYLMMQKLQQERLVVAVTCQAAAEAAFEYTLDYCKERKAFGRPIGRFQNSQFKLAEMATEIEIGRHFLDRLLQDHVAGKNVLKETCMSKWWHSDMLKRLTDECLQLHGGYGYMMEYEISKAFLDARVQSIFAGTNEIMKTVIAKQLGL